MKIILGTYTKQESQGIYEINLVNDTLEGLHLLAEAENATYLDYDSNTKTLYSVYQDEDQGGIAVWDYSNDLLTLKKTYLEEGVQPCYVRYDQAENLIYDANYHLGRMRSYDNDGVSKEFKYETGAKAHYVNMDPKTDDLFVCDLGLDTIHKYRLLNEIATYKTAKGMGPRHLVFHPEKPLLYILGELNNTIEVVKDNEFDFEHVQTVDMLNGLDVESGGGAIRISEDGKYVYATNRGHDSIVVFKVLDNGTLEFVQIESVYGEHPRDFAISPDGKYIVVANRDTNNLSLFSRDEDSGKVTLIQKDVYAPEAVCVLFVDEA